MSRTLSSDVEVRESQHSDILPIAFNMRKADVEEIWASNNATPISALTKGIQNSCICMTALYKGVPVAMFGVTDAGDRCGGEGIVWFLATEEVERHRLLFGIYSKRILKHFFQYYDSLYNWVDERNEKSIKWLRWLGALFLNPAPYGAMGLRFQFFQIQKGLCNV